MGKVKHFPMWDEMQIWPYCKFRKQHSGNYQVSDRKDRVTCKRCKAKLKVKRGKE